MKEPVNKLLAYIRRNRVKRSDFKAYEWQYLKGYFCQRKKPKPKKGA